MAEHGADLALFDRAVQRGVPSDGVQEVSNVRGISASGPFALADFFAFRIKNGPGRPADREGAFVAIKNAFGRWFFSGSCKAAALLRTPQSIRFNS